jgi:ribonuclease III
LLFIREDESMWEGAKKISLSNLETQLGYQFNNPGLLKKALTHASYYNQKEKNDINCFQRLEFLGDSVLNLSVSEYLYKKFPFFSEGKLSKLKSVMISQPFLVKFAGYIKLEKYIILGKSVDLVKGRGKFSILADCMEACLGSIYLDGGLGPCKKIVTDFIREEHLNLLDRRIVRDYKTILQEITQKDFNCLPTYRLLREEGLEHQKKFYVEVIIDNDSYGKGTGKNKKEAEQDAAYQAIKKIGIK